MKALVVSALFVVSAAFAAPPAEVGDLAWSDSETLQWTPEAGAVGYNVYRGDLAELAAGVPPRCHASDLATPGHATPAAPAPGRAFVYLATGESAANEEGTPGFDSAAAERALLGRCDPVLRHHVLDRVGFGRDEWSADRVATLGLVGYIDEQLDPASIDESTNAALNDRVALYDPPDDVIDLIARDVVQATYARRQLEQQATVFWTNHFNTYWVKASEIFNGLYPQCQEPGIPESCDELFPTVSYLETTGTQFREMEAFRDLAFNGNFREILEVSARSPAMILFLDGYANVVGAPNENYSRELLELYALGVDGGYTQTDVEELARVLTGWTICKKKLNFEDEPILGCIENYWEPTPPGTWSSYFVPPNHDCTAKTLFAGTPQELVIPDTCATPADGANDLQLALDAIAAHPATARFISTKLLQRFVTDTPEAAMVDAVVAEWNDAGNPAGVGDLREVLRAVLTQPALVDPDRVRGKIKTPFEHIVSMTRATRGTTNGIDFVLSFLVNAQHLPHYNAVPTGYAEDGGSWIDTTNTLERQNFGVYLTAFGPADLFGSDPMGLLADAGISTAPGNAPAIVDYWSDVLFGGALTPAERQQAIDFLETEIDGTPSPYDETRIRRTVGFMLGFGQFQEQ